MPHEFHSLTHFIVWPPQRQKASRMGKTRGQQNDVERKRRKRNSISKRKILFFPLDFCIWISILPLKMCRSLITATTPSFVGIFFRFFFCFLLFNDVHTQMLLHTIQTENDTSPGHLTSVVWCRERFPTMTEMEMNWMNGFFLCGWVSLSANDLWAP